MNASDRSHSLDSKAYNHLMGLTSLFEREFSIDWVMQLSEKKASEILNVLEHGLRQNWLRKNGPGVYSFVDLEKQKKWQDHLTSKEKEQLHRRIVEIFIEEVIDTGDKAEGISYHLLHISKNDAEGCSWLLRAGDNHLKGFRPNKALQCYSKVLNDLSKDDGKEKDGLYNQAAIKYSKVSTAIHDTKKVLSVLQEGIIRAKKWSNKEYQALLEMHLAKNEWLCSRYNSALRHFDKGWSLVEDLNEPTLTRSAIIFKTFFLYWQGRFHGAVSVYEKSIPDVDKFPKGRFPLIAALTLGHCYAQIGQVTQGLGMLDTIGKQCKERGDSYLASNAGITIGAVMLDIRRIDEALVSLECSIEEAKRSDNHFMQILGTLVLSFAYYLNKNAKLSIAHINEFLKYSTRSNVNVRLFPYLLELCWAMEQKKLPRISGLNLENEIQQMIKNKNAFMKGMAYRYRALLQARKGLPHRRIIQSLEISMRWLEESGHKIEIVRTQIELARNYLLLGLEEKSKKTTYRASKLLSFFKEEMVPDDLRYLIKKQALRGNRLTEVFELSHKAVSGKENRSTIQHIISTVNRFTGAERGAIFLLKKNKYPSEFRLIASRNLDNEEIARPSFNSSMKIIEKVALTGKGCILGTDSAKPYSSFSDGGIRSRICVPIAIRGELLGIFYHDNRLFNSVFKKSDMEIVTYFADQIALLLDNSRAHEEIQTLNQKLADEKVSCEEPDIQNFYFGDIIAVNPVFKQILAKAHQVGKTDTTVLIYGETGVGKGLLAEAIHRESSRYRGKFVIVHCNAIPSNLLPSEMFGHEKGSFTGAISRQIGRFELADGGTFFLDEIGSLPMDVQVQLLRVLQSKEFERLGGTKTIHSNFRLIAATHQDLEKEVKENRFRSDLFYRLNVFPIFIPPLRERKDDIPLLANHFLKIYSVKTKKSFEKIPEEEISKLLKYDWPGNVRELENVIERSAILSPDNHFRVLKTNFSYTESIHRDNMTLKEIERDHILLALDKSGWRIRGKGGAAEILDINPSTLEYRMKKLGIQRPKNTSKRNNAFFSPPKERVVSL